ncbi:MAG: HAMP domain-containing sensor histidine kinase [Xenococcus sp. MO_188.B8]|nr:HAMP domain-containing sensor histidine kinase [Xenococcus sp. MO_188.B8]
MKLLFPKFDPTSLKVRLTFGIAAVSAIGLGGLATWTSIRMQQILVSTHKENIVYIAERFPHDVEIYSDMVSLEMGAQKAIDNLSDENKILWVKNNNIVTALSAKLEDEAIAKNLLSLKNVPPIPQVQDLKGSYWLLCASPLKVKGVDLGQFYIAQDITSDQIMFLNLIRSLSIATLIAIAAMTITIAFYINRSMKPLKRISQITSNISADKLNEAQIHLDKAPSEVRELADTFEQMLERLGQSWEHQRQLLSNVSHELRTPLTIISGYLQSTLRRGQNLTDIQREALTTASSEADRTVQLLRDLLDLARADSGAIHFQNEKIILNDLIVDVAEMAQQYCDRHIKIESPNQLIAIEADLNRLKQVLLNLIDNAVKYSEPDTKITVSLKLCSKSEDAVMAVCDRGVGIPLQQQPRIFERFYRIDEARNRAGGTGLGLSIVKTLVEGMGGKIAVRSQLGEGSTFTVCFPAV